MSFSDLGYEKAELEIQQHEQQSPLAGRQTRGAVRWHVPVASSINAGYWPVHRHRFCARGTGARRQRCHCDTAVQILAGKDFDLVILALQFIQQQRGAVIRQHVIHIRGRQTIKQTEQTGLTFIIG